VPSNPFAARRISTQLFLFTLVAAVLVPLLAFAGFLLLRYSANEHARYERDAMQIARQVALVVDRELDGLLALLRGLSVSSSLAGGDFAQFQAEAQRLTAGTDLVIVLRDLETRQFVNTQRPFGTELPPAIPLTPADRAAFSAGRPVVSDVYASPVSGEPRIAVAAPILSGTNPVYVLAITTPTSRIRDAVSAAVPADWIVGIGDKSGIYVTRSAGHEEATGKPGLPEYLAKAVGRAGTFTSPNREGTILLAGYYRSDFSGWLTGANIPSEVVEAPLWRSVKTFAAVGIGALALSGLAAFLFGTRLTAATAGLTQRAAAVGEGRPVAPLTSHLSEFVLVGDALAAAARAVEERAREREKGVQRDALLASIFDAAGLCIGVTESLDDDYRFVVANRATAALFGEPEKGIEGRTASELGLGARQIEYWLDLSRRCAAADGALTVEYGWTPAGRGRRWFLATLTPLAWGAAGHARIAFTAIDITERKRSEEQRQLLINELNHRVKNTLATVQSIAMQTLRAPASTQDALKAFTDRLLALAKAHDVLTRESWEGADLRDIVMGAVEAHGGANRFAISGPPVWLKPSLSLSLALALHELATNAAKYGALALEGGSVAITWEASDTPEEWSLTLKWVERGGPAVAEPSHQGFGSRLIKRSLSAELGGEATLDFRPEGLVCTMTARVRRQEARAELAGVGAGVGTS
jgi:PAS domain S-box-containing protein